MNIYLESQYLNEIKEIIKKHLPKTAVVWIFGSRAKGNVKPFSDIDLAIDLGKSCSLDLLSDLNQAFDDSSIPYKVDIVDWNQISANFRCIIEPYRDQARIH